MLQLLERSAHELMAMGGDHRIIINDEIGLNIYGCKPYPSNTISYSSSTGSNISSSAYSFIRSYLDYLRKECGKTEDKNGFFINEYEKLRQRIKDFYELDPTNEIVFGPSGTDVEFIALAISRKHNNQGVHNIILGANEVGSGIENAAKGCYFSPETPKGKTVKVGAVIEGFESYDISTAYLPIRTSGGNVISDKDLMHNFVVEINNALKENKRPLIHVIHSSKTGLILPSWDTILEMKNIFGKEIDIIVDACQGRLSIYSLNRYLSFGAMVLLTGSKFLSGPPFSGALILPGFLSRRIKNIEDLPIGLSSIFGQTEFPIQWQNPECVEFDFINIGLLLRWKAAIYEMNKIFKIPNHRLKYVIDRFRDQVRQMVEDTNFLSLVHEDVKELPDYVYRRSPFELNTICTIQVKLLNESIDPTVIKCIHKALYSDLTSLISGECDLKTAIQLGQPVKISDTQEEKNYTLRIALSANQISEMALIDEDLINIKFESDMRVIKNKLSLILENLNIIKETFMIN